MASQVVLVLQGGGALGAYQLGVYQAMSEAGMEPDWVIGTSIGALNGAIIAGNPPGRRLERLRQFWALMEHHSALYPGMPRAFDNVLTVTQGIPAFFSLNPATWWNPNAKVGVENASFYRTGPLTKTLSMLVDFDYLNGGATRFTVGAVSARSGHMRYFDSKKEALRVEHVVASGSIPPAFPAVMIDGEPYWDGGIYSNTPIEAVLDDEPRRDSLIFSVQVWNPDGKDPESVLDVLEKHKEIQYASRAGNIEQQRRLHRLRHVIRDLTRHLPEGERNSPEVRELASWGCGTEMHVVLLKAPRLDAEDHTKDIDFTAAGIRRRVRAGHEDTLRALAAKPWERDTDSIEGVSIHEHF
ncbi:patatin-like phospholipase family protein [Pseudoduganella namucuonensis]|uniref:NTE family protein n=1 Tax=Pseudoduganella namucuonensis TaxID=1035707 RepID=A0A1I7IZB6_9BURK|nr:patatin-like phospholipase family protein [Pseudoduganella namucuonensis]SFU78234.1 NTE family protein [Pseudoduganella namucuonensis]